MNTVRTQSEQHIRPAPTVQVDHDPGGSSYGNWLLSKQPSGLPTGDSRKNQCLINETVQPGTVGYGAIPQHFLSLQSTARLPNSVIRFIFCDLAKNFNWILIYSHPETTLSRRV